MKMGLKKILAVVLGALTLATSVAAPTFADAYGSQSTSNAEYDVVVSQEQYVYLRSGPGAEYTELARPRNGQKLHIYETYINMYDGRPWGKTYYNGYNGWISLSWTTRQSGLATNWTKNTSYYNNTYDATVSSPDGFLNFRTGPSMYDSIITPIYNGANLVISAVYDNANDGVVWGLTNYNGMSGWVAVNPTVINHVRNASTHGYYVSVTNSNNLKLRRGPGTEYDLLVSYVPNGTSLYIEETMANSFDGRAWGKTRINGMTGWVSLQWTYRAPGV